MYILNQSARDYVFILDYCAKHGYDVNDVDDLKDAFVELSMDRYHLTDENLDRLATEFYNMVEFAEIA